MTDTINLQGFVRDVRYKATIAAPLTSLSAYPFDTFEINDVAPSGIINFPEGQAAYSRWGTPKRTRTFPFERLYNIYNSPFRITVIPVLKDEGAGSSNNDRIQYSTISWMNLLNIYIVLAYYSDAKKNRNVKRADRHCLTGQTLDSDAVNEQIAQILTYKQSALHWNRTLFETRFTSTYRQALDAYEEISKRTGVEVHSRTTQERYLDTVIASYDQFRDISLRGSAGAAMRESATLHEAEFVPDSGKPVFAIENYLGGVYHLTADGVVYEDGVYVIQESKNSKSKGIPKMPDIKDGLFKLILFSNIDQLKHNGIVVPFQTRLKLTGVGIRSSVRLPCEPEVIEEFLAANVGVFSSAHKKTIYQLLEEVQVNESLLKNKFTVEIEGNGK